VTAKCRSVILVSRALSSTQSNPIQEIYGIGLYAHIRGANVPLGGASNTIQMFGWILITCCDLRDCESRTKVTEQRWVANIAMVDNIDEDDRGFYRSCVVIFGYRRDSASRP